MSDNSNSDGTVGAEDDGERTDDVFEPDATIIFDKDGDGKDTGPEHETSVLQALEDTHDETMPRVALRDSTMRPSSELTQTSDQECDSRIQLYGEIARGGMGAIIQARDNDLGRDLAIKVLLDSHLDRPEVIQRFVEEAQIGGQLQHPGIVPVYELGRLPDSRPFFSMKLVEGQTLAAWLADRSKLAAERPRLIDVFAHICQTLGYAHSRGVIHRDLKPANVMVGAFGEVQVMDWGLAKVLDSSSRKPPSNPRKQVETVRTAAPSQATDALQTNAGSVMGTPAYMSPEQAQGETDRLDERCDVFGLGAILCEILTGKPPYLGGNVSEVFRLAASGELTDCYQRLDESDADQELISLAKRCLSADLEQRPRHAGIVADEVAQYLRSVDDRLRQAELDRTEARTKAAEEIKRRRISMALATAVVIILGLSAGGWIVLQKQQTELAQGRADAAEAKAERQRQAAADRNRLNRQVSNAVTEALALQSQARADRQRGLLDLTRAAESARRAESLLQTGSVDEELRGRVVQLVAELDAELKDQRLAVALDEAWKWDSEKLAHAGEDRTLVSGGGQMMFPIPAAAPLYRAAFAAWGLDLGSASPEQAAKRIRGCHPDLVGQLVVSLERWRELEAGSKTGERIAELVSIADTDSWRREFRRELAAGDAAALTARSKSSNLENQPPVVWVRLAVALRQHGAVTAAVNLLERLHRRDAGDYWVNYTLGQILAFQRPPQIERALRHATAAVAVRPRSALAHLGFNLIARPGVGNYSKDDPILALAAEHSARAVELDDKSDLAHFYMGNVLKDQGKLAEAESSFRRAIAIDKTTAAFHNNLGLALAHQNKHRDAAAAFREAIRLDPTHDGAHSNLGIAFKELGDLDRAVAAFREAIRLAPDFSGFHANLAMVLGRQRKISESLVESRLALKLDPGNFTAQYYLGTTLARSGKLDEGIKHLRIAAKINPRYKATHNNLGIALMRQQKIDEAIQEWKKALKLEPGDVSATNNLGNALYFQGKLDEAATAFRNAIRADPKNSSVHSNLGAVLLNQGKPEEALKTFLTALQQKPKDGEIHLNLGHAHKALGQYKKALNAYRKGHQLGSVNPRWRHPSAQWIQQTQRYIMLDDQLANVLAGKSPLKTAAERIEYGLLCYEKRRFVDAARFYVEAFAADKKLETELSTGHRHRAACVAVRAAGEKGLPDDKRKSLRQQAWQWLNADLKAWKALLETTPAAASSFKSHLQKWQREPDLASIRETTALTKLAPEERRLHRGFWQEVEFALFELP